MVIDVGASVPILHVETAASSASMIYRVAQGTRITTGHLLSEAWHAVVGDLLTGIAQIPFRNVQKPWEVECEAMRIGEQVFALFHVDNPARVHKEQLSLF